jgi:hypothetical protein
MRRLRSSIARDMHPSLRPLGMMLVDRSRGASVSSTTPGRARSGTDQADTRRGRDRYARRSRRLHPPVPGERNGRGLIPALAPDALRFARMAGKPIDGCCPRIVRQQRLRDGARWRCCSGPATMSPTSASSVRIQEGAAERSALPMLVRRGRVQRLTRSLEVTTARPPQPRGAVASWANPARPR